MRLFSRYRPSEWVFLAYFAYVALVAVLFRLSPEVILVAILVCAGAAAFFAVLSRPSLSVVRDWVPLGMVLLAYREMNWFSVTEKTRALETRWVQWDRSFLFDRGFREAIEALGPVLPGLLEFAYLLVYGIGVFSVGALYANRKFDRVDRFLSVYATGTLLSYALFPYFPSDPPRVVFPGADMPHQITILRELNLFLVGGYGIHSSVFPSAHVSSAFAAAWGLRRFLPECPSAGWGMLIYAVLVAVATVYGRYHYAVDALGGFGISLIALAIARRMR